MFLIKNAENIADLQTVNKLTKTQILRMKKKIFEWKTRKKG